MLEINPGLIFWTIVTFLAVLAILSKVAWKPLMLALTSREDGIRTALQQAENANAEAKVLLEENKRQLAQAEAQAQQAMREGREMGEKRYGDSHGWNVWIAVGLFVGWIALSYMGPMFELTPGVRAWYPPAALVAAAFTYWGARAFVPIMLAATVSALASPAGPESMWRVLAMSALLKGIYWMGARLLRRAGFDTNFSRTVDVALFAGVFAATAAVAALVALLNMRSVSDLSNPETLQLLRSFWIGDIVALFAVAPAILVVAPWLTATGRRGRRIPRFKGLRGEIVQVASIPVAIVFAALLTPSFGFFSYALCFLPLGWIALAHGPRIAALANVLFVLGALWSVHDLVGAGPKSLEVQAFAALLVLTGLMIGSVAD
ncbi:MAG: hypothetical protein ABI623_00190, partial [bacterium]